MNFWKPQTANIQEIWRKVEKISTCMVGFLHGSFKLEVFCPTTWAATTARNSTAAIRVINQFLLLVGACLSSLSGQKLFKTFSERHSKTNHVSKKAMHDNSHVRDCPKGQQCQKFPDELSRDQSWDWFEKIKNGFAEEHFEKWHRVRSVKIFEVNQVKSRIIKLF